MPIRGLRWSLAGSCALAFFALHGCSLILTFDEPSSGIDAGGEDGGPDARPSPDASTDPDASTAANCAVLEPNDSLATPQPITPMTIEAALCPSSDQDFYSFSILDAAELTITLNFLNTPVAGDLNLRLYDALGGVVSIASGTGTTDQIVHSPGLGNALPAGDYRVEVFPAVLNADKDYSLTLQIGP